MRKCERCGKIAPVAAGHPEGWADVVFIGLLCPDCYKPLQELRSQHAKEWEQKFNEYMQRANTLPNQGANQ